MSLQFDKFLDRIVDENGDLVTSVLDKTVAGESGEGRIRKREWGTGIGEAVLLMRRLWRGVGCGV